MASKKKQKPAIPAVLPWGMSKEGLQPNSVKAISQSKIKAFNVGRMNPLKKQSAFMKKKEEMEQKKKMEAKETAEVFEEFVASFQESESSGKMFVRGSTSIKPTATGDEAIPNPSGGSVYKPKSKLLQKLEHKKPEEKLFSPPVSATKKPPKKKGAEKKKSILELFKEELKRSQNSRKERRTLRETGTVKESVASPIPEEPFVVDEYKEISGKGSFDSGDPLTTNLYVGNINPKMNEENLCQLFGKFGPLASVKVMWPRTEEEKSRNKNCGFVAYMERKNAEKALDHFKGTMIMDYEIQIGWGKAVPVPPQPVYVPPDDQEDEQAKTLDPPSGLPFNAQPKTIVAKSASGDGYVNVPPPSIMGNDKDVDKATSNFDDVLYNAIIRVVIPTDVKLLSLIHRMIEFVIREGPMFEAMIMNREITNPSFQFLFDNRSPTHLYYRWKLFSILQGDSPETWRVDEFRMFEGGSLWKPPPLKNLRSKMLPPLEDDIIIRRGQLSTRQRDELEDQLRHLSMEREKIKKSMVWCMDHADSAEEIVECMCEALCITETPLPIKIARLYLVSDILQNCNSAVPNSSNFRRGFEGRFMTVIEHFHSVMISISSRMRAEQFKRRVLSCLRAWDQMSVYHYNVVDKFRLTFIGKTSEEMEKMKAFETVAALIGVDGGGGGARVGGDDGINMETERGQADIDGVSLFDDRPIDFSGGAGLDGIPMENLDGESFQEADIDGEPLGGADDGNDIDGVPLTADTEAVVQPVVVKSKWELVDYDSDDSEGVKEEEEPEAGGGGGNMTQQERQQLMAEVDERKRKILREVEVKAIELYDALEASGSYSRAEITERVDKYRDKLMQEAVVPKFSPPPVKKLRAKSRSPSPSVLDKYRLDDSPKAVSRRKRSGSGSPISTDHKNTIKRRLSKSPSPAKSPAPRKRSRSRSPMTTRPRKRSRSRSKSPRKKRSKSRSPAKASRRRSRSPRRTKRKSKSRSPVASKSSRKSKRRSRSRSRSPHKSKSKRSKH